MSRRCLPGRPYPQDTRETQLFPSYLNSLHSNICKSHESLRGMLGRKIPVKTLQSSIAWVFTLSLYHTTFTVKSHNKYNQIWHGIKANKTHNCKSQLYTFHYLGYEHLTAMVFTLHGLCFVVFALIFLLFLMVWEFWSYFQNLCTAFVVWLICFEEYDSFFKYHFLSVKTYKKKKKKKKKER